MPPFAAPIACHVQPHIARSALCQGRPGTLLRRQTAGTRPSASTFMSQSSCTRRAGGLPVSHWLLRRLRCPDPRCRPGSEEGAAVPRPQAPAPHQGAVRRRCAARRPACLPARLLAPRRRLLSTRCHAGSARAGSGPTEAKLLQQVAATKRADLAALTQQALGLCGLARCDTAPAEGSGGAAVVDGAPGAPAGSEGEEPAAALAGAVSVRLLTAACVKAAAVAARAERSEAGGQAARRAGGPRGRGAPGGGAPAPPADAPPSPRCAQLSTLLFAPPGGARPAQTEAAAWTRAGGLQRRSPRSRRAKTRRRRSQALTAIRRAPAAGAWRASSACASPCAPITVRTESLRRCTTAGGRGGRAHRQAAEAAGGRAGRGRACQEAQPAGAARAEARRRRAGRPRAAGAHTRSRRALPAQAGRRRAWPAGPRRGRARGEARRRRGPGWAGRRARCRGGGASVTAAQGAPGAGGAAPVLGGEEAAGRAAAGAGQQDRV